MLPMELSRASHLTEQIDSREPFQYLFNEASIRIGTDRTLWGEAMPATQLQ